MHQTQDDLITTTQACEILGVDRSTISRWTDKKLRDEERRLTPVMRLTGPRGPMLFRRGDVERLRDELDARRAS